MRRVALLDLRVELGRVALENAEARAAGREVVARRELVEVRRLDRARGRGRLLCLRPSGRSRGAALFGSSEHCASSWHRSCRSYRCRPARRTRRPRIRPSRRCRCCPRGEARTARLGAGPAPDHAVAGVEVAAVAAGSGAGARRRLQGIVRGAAPPVQFRRTRVRPRSGSGELQPRRAERRAVKSKSSCTLEARELHLRRSSCRTGRC